MQKIKDNIANANKKVVAIVAVSLFLIVGGVLLLRKDNDYVIKFNTDGGTVIAEQKLSKGNNPVIPEEPTRENYVFLGWLCNGEPFDFSVPLEGNVVLTANWAPIEDGKTKYVVKFNSDGGTTIISQLIDENGKVEKPNNPVKTGYKFIEWTLNSKPYDFNTPVKSDLTLTASYYMVDSGNNDSTKIEVDNSLVTPKLEYPSGLGNGEIITDGVYIFDLFVNGDAYSVSGKDGEYTVDGFEVFEKKDGKYVSVGKNEVGGAVPVEIDPGAKRVFVAKVYVNKNNKTVYSNYSAELTIDKTTIKTPTIYYPAEMGYFPEDGTYLIDFGVVMSDFYIEGMDIFTADGFEIFEKNGSNYKSLGTNEIGGAVPVEFDPGTKKTLVAKVYVLNKNKKKIYSNYSKEVVIDKTNIKSPTLLPADGMGVIPEDGIYIIDLFVNMNDYVFKGIRERLTVDGFEVYEKVGTAYNSIGSNEVGGAVPIEIEVGEKKTFVAKAYVLDKNKKKVYSAFSKELIIDKSTIKAPTLFPADGMGIIPEDGIYIIDLFVESKDYYDDVFDKVGVNGFEVFEKVGSTYKSIGSNELGGAVVAEIEVGQKKTYVAKVYVLDKNNKKVYSNYSQELVIDKSIIKAPRVYQFSGLSSAPDENGMYIIDFGVYLEDYYVEMIDTMSVDGFELYEKNGSTYRLLGSNEVGGAVVVEMAPGTKKTLVARVYVFDKNNKKVYSDYSKEIVVDKTK